MSISRRRGRQNANLAIGQNHTTRFGLINGLLLSPSTRAYHKSKIENPKSKIELADVAEAVLEDRRDRDRGRFGAQDPTAERDDLKSA